MIAHCSPRLTNKTLSQKRAKISELNTQFLFNSLKSLERVIGIEPTTFSLGS